MNDVPLIQSPDTNSINTSIIAIKKQLRTINEALGLIDIPDAPDLSPYVKKSDVVDTVESGNMNPVTSNAVANSNAMPVDEVTVDNMHSVTSNAVAIFVNNKNYLKGNGDSYDMNVLQHNYLPQGFYVLSGWASNYLNFAPVPATAYQHGCMIYIEITNHNFTIQRVKTTDHVNGVWYYYEYERYCIDFTWFGWQLIRQTRM